MLAKLKTKIRNKALEIKFRDCLKILLVSCSLVSFSILPALAQAVTITELEIIDDNSSSSSAFSSSLVSSSSSSSNQESSSSQNSVNSNISQQSSSQAGQQNNANINSLPFTFESAEVFVNGSLSMVLGPALNENNNPIVNAPCEIWVLPPKASIYVVLYGNTNTQGICSYSTNQPASSQNLGVVQIFQNRSGLIGVVTNSLYVQPSLGDQFKGGNNNLAAINGQIGRGQAFGIVQYNSILGTSNIKPYNVNGGIIDIGFEYPGIGSENSFNAGGRAGSGGQNGLLGSIDEGETGLGSIFDLLARTGGYAFPISLISLILILIIFFLTRKRDYEDEDSYKNRLSKNKTDSHS